MAGLGVEYGCRYVLEAPAALSKANQLINSGFETGVISPWNFAATSWTESKSEVISSPFTGSRGLYQARLTGKKDNNTTQRVMTLSTVTNVGEVLPGNRYSAKVLMNVADNFSGGLQIYLNWFKGLVGLGTVGVSPILSGTGVLTHELNRITAPAEANHVQLVIQGISTVANDTFDVVVDSTELRELGDIAVFNDSTDADFVGILSPESSGLDSADVREAAVDATEEDGGVHGDFFYGRRPVVLQGTVIASSVADRNEKVAKIKGASSALRGDATLTWKPTGATSEVGLNLRRQQPLRVTKGYVKDFQIPMVAADIFPKAVTPSDKSFSASDTFITGLSSELVGIAIDSTYIYWTDFSAGTIGRAKLDGSEVNQNFITGLTSPYGLAVNATNIYWTNSGGAKVGRAKIDGTEVNKEFVSGTGTFRGITIDGTWMYWAQITSNYISRAKLDGTSVTTEFITAVSGTMGHLANDGTYIYWAAGANIGRAKLTGEEKNNTFIETPTNARGVATDGTYIYWTDATFPAVGRALLNGTSPIEKWITNITNAGGIAASSTALYWISSVSKRIGRYNTVQTLTTGGDTQALPVVKVYGPGSKFKLENQSTGKYVELSGVTLATAAEYFEIDFKAHTVKKNGATLAYNAVQFTTSTWWALEPGENALLISGGFAVTEWKDTYL